VTSWEVPTPGTPRRNRHRARHRKRLDLAQLLLDQRPQIFRDAGGPRTAPHLAGGIPGPGLFQQQPALAGLADLNHQQVLAHRFAGDGPPGNAAHRGRIDRDGCHGRTRRRTPQPCAGRARGAIAPCAALAPPRTLRRAAASPAGVAQSGRGNGGRKAPWGLAPVGLRSPRRCSPGCPAACGRSRRPFRPARSASS
jgi:hypothetical protein